MCSLFKQKAEITETKEAAQMIQILFEKKNTLL